MYVKKVFEKCKRFNKEFELGSTLQGIITDWSDAEISGLKMAIGNDLGQTKLIFCFTDFFPRSIDPVGR